MLSLILCALCVLVHGCISVRSPIRVMLCVAFYLPFCTECWGYAGSCASLAHLHWVGKSSMYSEVAHSTLAPSEKLLKISRAMSDAVSTTCAEPSWQQMFRKNNPTTICHNSDHVITTKLVYMMRSSHTLAAIAIKQNWLHPRVCIVFTTTSVLQTALAPLKHTHTLFSLVNTTR